MSKELLVLCCLFGVAARMTVEANQQGGKTIALDLKSTPDGQLFYVQLQVGEVGKQQTFNMLVATTYYITWIPSKDVSPTRGYVDRKNLLRERQDFRANGGIAGGSSSFHFHWDWLQVGPQMVKNQRLAVKFRKTDNYFEGQESILDGMLGLSVYETKPKGSKYLLKNLHHLSYIDKLMFSLYINNSVAANDDDDNPKGALVLGGIDQNYFTGDINYVKLYEDSLPVSADDLGLNKTLIISSIQLDWSRVGQETRTSLDLRAIHRTGKIDMYSPPARLRLDSTTKLFIGDKKTLDKMHLKFMGAKSVGDAGLYVFYDCRLDNKPDIVFSLDTMDIMLTPEDYLVRGEIDGSQCCFSAFKPFKSRTLDRVHPVWVFGTRFLRKYYTVFDFENDVVGFATPK